MKSVLFLGGVVFLLQKLYRRKLSSSVTVNKGNLSALGPQMYRNHGVVLVPDAFDDVEMKEISQAFDALMVDPLLGPLKSDNPRLQLDQNASKTYVLRKVEPFLDISPALDSSVRVAVQRLVEMVLEEEVSLFEDKANCKQKYDGSAFPWHQDFFYWQRFSPELLTVFVCVDDMTVENGCLQIVTGPPAGPTNVSADNMCSTMPLLSHRMGPVDGSTAPDYQLDAHELTRSNGFTSSAITLEAKAGTAVIFSSLTPHASAPNMSSKDRRAILLSFCPKHLGEFYGLKTPDDGGGTQLAELSLLYLRANRQGDKQALADLRKAVSEISHRRVDGQ